MVPLKVPYYRALSLSSNVILWSVTIIPLTPLYPASLALCTLYPLYPAHCLQHPLHPASSYMLPATCSLQLTLLQYVPCITLAVCTTYTLYHVLCTLETAPLHPTPCSLHPCILACCTIHPAPLPSTAHTLASCTSCILFSAPLIPYTPLLLTNCTP